MLKLKQVNYMLILVILLQMIFPINISYAEETNDYLSTIEEIVQWKKTSMDIPNDDPLLDKTFLENAGDTTGDWFPVGIGRIGYPDNYDSYLAVIENEVTERYKEKHLLSESKATEWHRISLAVLAMGGDPTKLGSDKDSKPINLIADGTYNRAEKNSIGEQGINGWIWALITLDSMRYKIPDDGLTDREEIIVEILQRQLEDGGFSLGEESADPDMTGMAITALAPYYNSEEVFTYERVITGKKETRTVRDVVDESLKTLSSMQLDSGGFSSMEMENTESIVQVIVALTSLGIDIFKDERFIKDGNTIYDALMTFQMNDGGFTHSNEYDEDNPTAKPGESNAMATDQALYALVALYRFEHDYRSLYDYRPELSEKVKEDIVSLEKIIDELNGDEQHVSEAFAQYQAIPLEERSYVSNYYKLAEEMDQLNIENDTEAMSNLIGVNENGNGTITPIFSDSSVGSSEVTAEDLANIDLFVDTQTTEHVVEIVTLINKLKNADDPYEEKIALLEKEKEKIDQLQKEIDDLNEMIVQELFPFEDIDVKDEDIVKSIMKRYESLSEFDQAKIVNYEDVEKSLAQIESMKRKKMLTILLGMVLIIGLAIVLYRRKKRKQAKKASSYLND